MTFIHSVAKMPERTSPHRSGLWASPREGVSFPQGLRPVGLSGLTRCSCPRNGLGGCPLSHPTPIFCLGISIGPTGMVPGACFTSSPGSRPSLPRLGTFHLCLPRARISVLVCERGPFTSPGLCGHPFAEQLVSRCQTLYAALDVRVESSQPSLAVLDLFQYNEETWLSVPKHTGKRRKEDWHPGQPDFHVCAP